MKNDKLIYNNEIQELELKYKRKELVNAFLKTMQFNTLLENIKQDITNQNYKNALVNISVNQPKNFNFENFKIQFNKLYPNLVVKLQEKYPQLTETEYKICILIISDFKSIEIAKLLYVSNTTIAKYRNRLRKKLKIASNTDIETHLINHTNMS